jgi:hypothetical protein
VKLYGTAYLAFGVLVDRDLEELLESGVLRDFNKANGSDLGHLTAGSFSADELFLVTYCEGSESYESKPISPNGFSRKQRAVWRRQIEKFLRENRIEARDRIGLRLLADIDN